MGVWDASRVALDAARNASSTAPDAVLHYPLLPPPKLILRGVWDRSRVVLDAARNASSTAPDAVWNTTRGRCDTTKTINKNKQRTTLFIFRKAPWKERLQLPTLRDHCR